MGCHRCAINGTARSVVITAACIFLAALVIRLALIPYFNYSLDDSYITFRVARNIASGLGFVYNPGEHVQAVTTPLYSLVMALGELAGISSVIFSKILNSILAAATCSIVYLLLSKTAYRLVTWTAVLALVLNPVSMFVTLTGMESSLLFFLATCSVFLLREHKYLLLGFCMGLLALSRPEGCILSCIIWLSVCFLRREGLLKVSVPFILIALSWFMFTHFYFGSVIPNSYLAKKAYFAQHPVTALQNLRSMYRFFAATVPLVFISPVLLVWGGFKSLRERDEFLPVSIWLGVVLFLQIKADFVLVVWYLHMLLPLVLLIFSLGFNEILSKLPRRVSSFFSRKSSFVVSFLLVLSLSFFIRPWIREENDMRILDEHMGRIGGWFPENGIPTDRVVALEAIGRVGYESNLIVLDRMGLCSPEVIPYLTTQTDSDVNLMRDFQPDYYICDLELSETDVPGYVPVAAFPRERPSRVNDVDAIMLDYTYIYHLER